LWFWNDLYLTDILSSQALGPSLGKGESRL